VVQRRSATNSRNDSVTHAHNGLTSSPRRCCTHQAAFGEARVGERISETGFISPGVLDASSRRIGRSRTMVFLRHGGLRRTRAVGDGSSSWHWWPLERQAAVQKNGAMERLEACANSARVLCRTPCRVPGVGQFRFMVPVGISRAPAPKCFRVDDWTRSASIAR
jgi:hypothetical protein